MNFQSKLVALTVLYTPSVSTDEYPSPSPSARIFVCPLRVATFSDGHYSIVDGAACYLVKTGNWTIQRFDRHNDPGRL